MPMLLSLGRYRNGPSTRTKLSFLKNKSYYIYIFFHAHEWKSEDNLQKLVFLFHLGVPGLKHKSLGLTRRTFIHWLVLTAPKFSFLFTSLQISKSILKMTRSLAYFSAKYTNGKISCYGPILTNRWSFQRSPSKMISKTKQ